jgi:hypothetical protein
MKGAFLILAGGILFTGVFLGGFLAGGGIVYAMDHDEEYQASKRAKRSEVIRYKDIYTGGSDIPEENK